MLVRIYHYTEGIFLGMRQGANWSVIARADPRAER
jgi:hypothetical protein